ncbi:7TM diverse intracellular signaling domain-containing protein [Oligoflexus tunisiensis]|uniref:7TM diverse intracellular signaling domain-containing protein n=1 Tax=Oligoflexus tunisiensis TaxID=708132 RepID=UPI000ADA1FCD|nr:7TM diverse intracellular signaling domain-containing protein [Oligoflexus tunisiensis]
MRLLLLLTLLITPGRLLAEAPEAQKGVLDLRAVDLDRVGSVRLEGEWRFYWNQFVPPDAIEQNADFSYQQGPRDWMNYQLNGENLPWSGAATLQLKVLLPPLTDELVMRAHPMVMAGRVFVNGQLIHEAGTPGLDRETPGHTYQTELLFLGRDLKELNLVVHVSNHMITRSGYAAFDIGLRPNMIRSESRASNKTHFLLGGIFLMAIYHLCLFLMRRTELSNLYFSAMCLGNGIFQYAASGLAALHFPGISSERVWDIFFIGWYSGGLAFAWFVQSVFPREFNKKYAHIGTIIAVGTILTVIFGRTDQFTFAPKLHKLGNTLLFLYICVVCVRAMKARINDARLFLLAAAIYYASAVNDMIVTTGYAKGELLSATGLFIFLFVQSILLSRRFSNAFHRLALAETEIRTLNEGLEHKVQQKTREIRAILDHIKQGIFTLRLNPKAEIVMGEDYSRHLEEILEEQDLNARKFQDVLLARTDLTNDQRSSIRSTIVAAVGEDEVSFLANKDNLVRELRFLPADREKILELDWEAMHDDAGRTEQILVSMRDVTQVRQLQQQSVRQQKELEYISEIVNTTPDQFAKFVDMSSAFLDENERLIRQNRQKNLEVIKILFINMHTIKGTARTYYFHKMTGILHDTEQHYADLLRKDAEPWDQDKLLRDLQETRNIIQLYEQINNVKLGRKRDRSLIEVNRKVVEDKVNSLNLIDTSAMDARTRHIIEDTRRTFNEVFYSRSIDVLEDILSGAERVARDLGKEVPIIKINDPGISISQEALELFHQVFHHIIRNSLDHGIETAEERIQAQKRPTGTLYLDLMENADGSLLMIYRDDGRGLNLAKLEEQGYAKGILLRGRDYTPERIAALIFENGLSTCNRLTEISGRGVGMDAVRQYLDRAGGSIQVVLNGTPHHGFCPFAFHIHVPKSLYTTAA